MFSRILNKPILNIFSKKFGICFGLLNLNFCFKIKIETINDDKTIYFYRKSVDKNNKKMRTQDW